MLMGKLKVIRLGKQLVVILKNLLLLNCYVGAWCGEVDALIDR